MAYVSPSTSVRPNSWLRQLARLKPARWPVARCVRVALAISLPILAGILLDSPATFLMMSLGALGLALGERDGPYASRFREIVIIAPLGAAGFFLGYLGGLPWAVVIAAMACAAFLAGIISSYGSAWSAGATQGLLMGCIAIAIPAIAPFWKPAAFFLGGCCLYALLLGIEALIFRKRPFIDLIAHLLDEIASLALMRAEGVPESEEVPRRRVVTDAISNAYAQLLASRYRHPGGRSAYLDWEASVLLHIDRIFTATLASKIPQNLEAAATELKAMAAMVRQDKGPTTPVLESSLPSRLLPRAVKAFRQTYWRDASASPVAASSDIASGRSARLQTSLLDRLAVAPETVKWAAILALCLALAFATRWINENSHWYWTPLTVIIVLKPDLGSVFARTMLRVLGTLLGVVAGVLIFMVFPKGLALVAILAILAGALPWAAQRSYALATFCATIIVLLLLDEIAPGIHNIDYGLPRLVDTLMGGAIILVFAYFLWPRTHRVELEHSFQAARHKLAAYLSSLKPSQASIGKSEASARRNCYIALARMRAQLQNAMQEPAPAGPEAAAWFPLVTSAEQLCDHISAWTAKYSITNEQEGALDQLAAWVAGDASDREKPREETDPGSDPFSQLVLTVQDWLDQLHHLTDAHADAPGHHMGHVPKRQPRD